MTKAVAQIGWRNLGAGWVISVERSMDAMILACRKGEGDWRCLSAWATSRRVTSHSSA